MKLLLLFLVLESAHLMVNANGDHKLCKPKPKFVNIFVECVNNSFEGKSLDEVKKCSQQENDKRWQEAMNCIMKNVGAMNDENILSKDGWKANLPEILDANDTKLLAQLGFVADACFYGFKGTAEETSSIIKCLRKLQDVLCKAPEWPIPPPPAEKSAPSTGDQLITNGGGGDEAVTGTTPGGGGDEAVTGTTPGGGGDEAVTGTTPGGGSDEAVTGTTPGGGGDEAVTGTTTGRGDEAVTGTTPAGDDIEPDTTTTKIPGKKKQQRKKKKKDWKDEINISSKFSGKKNAKKPGRCELPTEIEKDIFECAIKKQSNGEATKESVLKFIKSITTNKKQKAKMEKDVNKCLESDEIDAETIQCVFDAYSHACKINPKKKFYKNKKSKGKKSRRGIFEPLQFFQNGGDS